VVRLEFERAAFVATGGLLVFVVLAVWLLRLMPLPHGRLQYTIAGTAATAAGLGTVFVLVAIRRAGWAAKRRE
jgi:ABC-type transporter Mla subunit MlaD